jgi:alpha-D-ribose 1-methylphosphonate 5-triphosphate diphosphatase
MTGAPLASHDDTTVADVDEAAMSGCRLSEFPAIAVAAAQAFARGLLVIASAPNLACGWPLPEAARTVSIAPAQAMGLDDRGEVALGRRADVIIVQRTSLGPMIRETWANGLRVF